MCKRNRVAIFDASKNTFRLQGFKNIDLWVYGRLYPMDLTWKSTPPFKAVTSLLQFVVVMAIGGEGGLLGYTQSLDAQNNILEFEQDLLVRENVNLKYTIEQYKTKLCNINETIPTLNKQVNTLREKQIVLGLHKREKKIQDIENLKLRTDNIKERIHAIK